MIEESYVSFNTAKLLKKAGFDVPTSTHYSNSGEVWQSSAPEDYNEDKSCKACSRPTQALAARWLREVHRISVDAAFMAPSTNIDVWQYFIGKMDDMIWPGDFETSERTYATYEEAMEAGLQEAIKLIKKIRIMDTNLTVHEIEDLIVSKEGGVRKNLCVPNVSWGMNIDYEADLLIITKSGYCTEYEIKRSYSDFLADMKKDEYAHKAPWVYKFYYVICNSQDLF